MTEPDRLDWIRNVLPSNARIGDLTPQCLDEETIAALADGSIEPERREAVLSHLAGCVRCGTAVASVAQALNDPAVARELSAPGDRRWVFRIALPLAAAAALLLVVSWPRSSGDGGSRHRGSPPFSAPVPIAPVGVVSQASPLEWTAVMGADRYRVTLTNAAGRVLYETEGADTVATLPDSVPLTPGRSYVWIVEARTGFGRWSTSQLAEFSIAGAVYK